MSWLDVLNTPVEDLFKKKEGEQAEKKDAKAGAPAGMPALPKELEGSPEAKGLMSMFYRKWKDPAFLKQLRTLAAHMAKDGVDLKNQGQIKAWLEKNKAAVEAGQFKDLPTEGAKVETYVKTGPDIGRNDPCHCGSGKKFKKCHGANA
jgi:hypothetical protein